MSVSSDEKAARLGFKIVIALVSCMFGLGLVLYGFGAGIKSSKKEASAGGAPAAQAQRKKPARTWNMALGDVVIVTQELGFSIRAAKEKGIEPSKVVARIDSQLQKLRELYRQETENNPALMGNMIVQMSVADGGNVTQVKEITSRLPDGDFKKAVIAEISNWTFPEIITESTTINFPLLFIREGMDITTLVEWEKSLAQVEDKSMTAGGATRNRAVQQTRTAEAPRATPPLSKVASTNEAPPRSPARPVQALYQIKYATSLRAEPNFSSASLTRFTIGTKVALVNNRGEWLEVRAADSGLSGYIRKEFVAPVEVARKQ
ncbi:MAG: AgmX/PglI C-terminal domain-containing protein [Alphaproteobacteria bacterium]